MEGWQRLPRRQRASPGYPDEIPTVPSSDPAVLRRANAVGAAHRPQPQGRPCSPSRGFVLHLSNALGMLTNHYVIVVGSGAENLDIAHGFPANAEVREIARPRQTERPEVNR